MAFSLCRYAATRAVVIAITCTFFEFFNIPVFWPILVMYFIVLFVITMKRQIKVSQRHQHAQKHELFSIGSHTDLSAILRIYATSYI